MHAPQQPADNRSSAGFTLIEILVAFTVATLLLGALYQVFSTGLRSSASAEHYADAVLLAAAARAQSSAGHTSELQSPDHLLCPLLLLKTHTQPTPPPPP